MCDKQHKRYWHGLQGDKQDKQLKNDLQIIPNKTKHRKHLESMACSYKVIKQLELINGNTVNVG